MDIYIYNKNENKENPIQMKNYRIKIKILLYYHIKSNYFGIEIKDRCITIDFIY